MGKGGGSGTLCASECVLNYFGSHASLSFTCTLILSSAFMFFLLFSLLLIAKLETIFTRQMIISSKHLSVIVKNT